MEYEKKLRIRRNIGISYIVLGVTLIVIAYFKNNDVCSSFGAVLAVIGLARVVQMARIMKNPELSEKRKTAENDERNIMLWTKARSMAFSIYIYVGCIAIIALYAFNLNLYGQIVTYNLFGFVLIYWICHFILSRKY